MVFIIFDMFFLLFCSLFNVVVVLLMFRVKLEMVCVVVFIFILFCVIWWVLFFVCFVVFIDRVRFCFILLDRLFMIDISCLMFF